MKASLQLGLTTQPSFWRSKNPGVIVSLQSKITNRWAMKKRLLMAVIANLTLACMPASAKEVAPDQTPSLDESATGRPLGGGKPVTTTTIRRCPDGYELVARANGRRGCAKDIVQPNN
jgi:hypothetical protein